MRKRVTKNVMLVANWKSDVGYAWWLMENFWVQMSHLADYSGKQCYLIYPLLSNIPKSISSSSIICKELNYNFESLKGYYRLLRFIRGNNIGFIYLTDKPYFSLQYLLFRLVGVKKIVIHDHTPGERSISVKSTRKLKIIRNSLSAITADSVIAVTDYVKERHLYSSCIPPSKIHVAKNGIMPIGRDPNLAHYANCEFDIPVDAKIVFTSGRATRYKGIDFIIECANHLINIKKLNDIYFVYCGDGPDIDDFKALSTGYGLSKKFIYAGVRNDVRKLVQSCHVGIQASKGEVGYSLSILEYMSAGLATIVPDNPSVCASIDKGINGLVFKENNVFSACDVLFKAIYNDSLRQTLSINAQRTIEVDYNLEKTNTSFTSILETIYFNIEGRSRTTEHRDR